MKEQENDTVYQDKKAYLEWETDPKLLFQYDLLKKSSEMLAIEKIGNFYYFRHADIKKVESIGWKLHISVDPSAVEKAFNLAAPIFARYIPIFKVIDLEAIENLSEEEKLNARLYQGAQITLYLETENELHITPEKLENVIEEITQIFKKNNIKSGVIPASDAPTKSDYFSIRNSKLSLPESFCSIENVKEFYQQEQYISARISGCNFNPLNFENPYQSILKNPVKFNFLEHFKAFVPKERKLAEEAMAFSIYAYLREYTLFSTLEPDLMKCFISQCLSLSEKIEADFIKKEYRDDETLQTSIKFAMMFVVYSSVENFKEEDASLFLEWYDHQDDFYKTLKLMYNKIQSVKKEDNFFITVDTPSFPEFISKKRMSLCEEKFRQAKEEYIDKLDAEESLDKYIEWLLQYISFHSQDPIDSFCVSREIEKHTFHVELSKEEKTKIFQLLKNENNPEIQMQVAAIYFKENELAIPHLIAAAQNSWPSRSSLFATYSLIKILEKKPDELMNYLELIAEKDSCFGGYFLGKILGSNLKILSFSEPLFSESTIFIDISAVKRDKKRAMNLLTKVEKSLFKYFCEFDSELHRNVQEMLKVLSQEIKSEEVVDSIKKGLNIFSNKIIVQKDIDNIEEDKKINTIRSSN